MNIWNAILKRLEKYCDEQNILIEKLFIDLRENRKINNFYERARRNDLEPSDYDDKNIQLAYVLRYFNLYCFQVYSCLSKYHYIVTPKKSTYSFWKDFTREGGAHNIALFGSGPCPEMIGLHKFIKEYSRDVFFRNRYRTVKEHDDEYQLKNNHAYSKFLKYYSFDIKNEEWHFARKIFLGKDVKKLTPIKFDFTTDFNDLLADYSNFFSLISFQNCLVEIAQNKKELFAKQIGKILVLLKKNGYIIISDRMGDQIDTLFDLIIEELSNSAKAVEGDPDFFSFYEYKDAKQFTKAYDLDVYKGSESLKADNPPSEFKRFFTNNSNFIATKKNDFKYLVIQKDADSKFYTD